MNKKIKTILGIVLFAAFMVIAYVAYNGLSDRIKPSSEQEFAKGTNATETDTNIPSSSKENNEDSDKESNENSNDDNGKESSQGNKEESESTSETAGETEKITPAPDFTMLDVDGNEVKLSDYIGKPLVINFWASWCPPCKKEMPHFEKVYTELKDEVTFLMVNATDGVRETVEKGQEYVTDNGFTFPVYFDTKQEAVYNYGISSFPTTFFVNKDGNIVTGYIGMMDEETLRSGIEASKES